MSRYRLDALTQPGHFANFRGETVPSPLRDSEFPALKPLEVIMLPVLCTISLLLGSHAVVPDYFAIQDAFHAGELSPAEFTELLVQAMTQPETIPSSYLTEQEGRGACLTTIFMGAMEAARQDPEAMDVLDRVRFRPTKQYSFVSPDGLFTIHYDTSGDHAVYQPDVDLNPADGIPDYVNRCAEIFDLSWHVEVDSMGSYSLLCWTSRCGKNIHGEKHRKSYKP